MIENKNYFQPIILKNFEIVFFTPEKKGKKSFGYLFRYHKLDGSKGSCLIGELIDWRGKEIPLKEELFEIINNQEWKHTRKNKHLMRLGGIRLETSQVKKTGIVIPDLELPVEHAYENYSTATDFKDHMPTITSVGDKAIKRQRNFVTKIKNEVERLSSINDPAKNDVKELHHNTLYLKQEEHNLQDLVNRSEGRFSIK